MSDISMCSGIGCKLKESCHRFTAEKGMRQSFFSKPPILDGECLYHWHNDFCKSCGQTYGIHKLSCETKKITILL